MEQLNAFLQKHSKFINRSNLIFMFVALGWLGYQHFNPKEEHLPIFWEWAAHDHITVESIEIGLVCSAPETRGDCLGNWVKYRELKGVLLMHADVSWDVMAEDWRHGTAEAWLKDSTGYALDAARAEILEVRQEEHDTVDALDVSKMNGKTVIPPGGLKKGQSINIFPEKLTGTTETLPDQSR